MALALTKLLYEAVTGAKTDRTRIEFIPGSDVDIVVHNSDGCCDIGVTKKAYLAIFKEGHSFFVEGYPKNAKCLTDKAEIELWETYYATIALLCTTNEHMTALRVHEDIVWTLVRRGLLQLKEETALVMALVTSKFDRINKSLALWHWVRTLYCAGAFEPSNGLSILRLMEQVLKSMEIHFCNYAAGFTAAWLVQVAQLKENEKLELVNMIKCGCTKNVTDVSLWTLMGTVLLGAEDQRVASDYRRIESKLAAQGIEIPARHTTSLQNSNSLRAITEGLLQWLLAIEAPYKTPYEQILRNPVGIDVKLILRENCTTKNSDFSEVMSYLLKRYT